MLKKICLKGIQQGSGKGRDVFLRGNPGKNTRFYLMLSNPMCCSMRPQRWKRKHTETYWFCFHLWFLSSFCSEILKMETWPPFPKKNVKIASDFWRNWVSIYLAVTIILVKRLPQCWLHPCLGPLNASPWTFSVQTYFGSASSGLRNTCKRHPSPQCQRLHDTNDSYCKVQSEQEELSQDG